MTRFNSILDTIGNTPLVRLDTFAPPGVNLYAKLESFNPMGSVKDRMALAVIEAAERSGELCPGQTVVEATSGNTGIGLAMVCARKGYPLVVTMAENFSVERRKLLRFLGARVVLTPAAAKGSGMLAKARELAAAHGWYLPRQFDNPANAEVHSRTTAREILDDFAGERLDYWVSGFGTGGTLQGVARRLKSDSPATRVVVAEPDNSPLLASGIRQPRDEAGAPSASHPRFRPHLMQGWSPDFISGLVQEVLDDGLVDEIMPVAGGDALRLSRELARREGIFVGITSGATLAAALAVARRSPPGTNIVCMLPDTGERYLSTPLFEDIDEAMGPDEIALSESTPGCRFEAIGTPPAARAVTAPAAEPDAAALVASVVAAHPVVMFALEWCEFCWSVRRLCERLGIPLHSVDLDAVAMQADDRGGQIRAALSASTNTVTLPQIFVAGRHLGGCTEFFDACDSGELAGTLAQHGVAVAALDGFNPRELLPRWLQPRRSA